ncbi:MAG: hypothetical protein AAGD86_01805 [Pseudomonadota bacterium]
MRHLARIAASSLLLCTAAAASNLTEDSTERTTALIDAAVWAYGGELLTGLTTVVIESEDISHAADQALRVTPPWAEHHAQGYSAIAFDSQTFVQSSRSAGYDFHNGTIVDGEHSYRFDYRAGTRQSLAELDFDTSAAPFIRVTPALLVRELAARACTARFLGEVNLDGRLHDVVGFTMAAGSTINLYFDRMTHLLTRSERYLNGVGRVEYRYFDQEPVDGIPFNSRVQLFLDGELHVERRVVSTRLNVPVAGYADADGSLKTLAMHEPDPHRDHRAAGGLHRELPSFSALLRAR